MKTGDALDVFTDAELEEMITEIRAKEVTEHIYKILNESDD